MAQLDMAHATFEAVSVNELGLDQKMSEDPTQVGQPSQDDPVGLRFGAWANPMGRLKWYIAKISMDVLRWKDGKKHRTEVGFLKLAVDEMVNNDGEPVPMVGYFMPWNTTDSSDAAMGSIFSFSRKGFHFHVPVKFMAGADVVTSAPSAPFNLRAPGGQTELHCQGDGNAVMYDVRPGLVPPAGWTGPSGLNGPMVALSTFKDGQIRDFREDGNYS